ncbi:hypothetical protein [Amycolatopsis sp. cmx-11-12]|uniref:hypothetical protein n=1 Tax=Amycolatopsis sp. cmx-11-12 TaxID=2785795 RepID=UPI0039180CF1
MALVTRCGTRWLAIGVMLAAGAVSLSSASAAPGDSSVDESAAPRPVASAAAGLTASHYVRNTVSRIAKLGSNLATGEGRYDSTIDAASRTLTGSITLPKTENAYFVTFGFMPVTSTVELRSEGDQGGSLLKEPGDAGEVAARVFPDGKKYFSVIVDLTLRLTIHLSETKVDGKVLDVGANCRTRSPMAIKIRGLVGLQDAAPPTTLKSGFDIPPFSGCGGRENLDDLITGLISGPGNEMSTSIAVRCISTCVG